MPATCPASFPVTPPPTWMPHQHPDLLPSRHHFIHSTQLPTPRVTPQTSSSLLTVSSPNFHPSSSLSLRQSPFQNPPPGDSPIFSPTITNPGPFVLSPFHPGVHGLPFRLLSCNNPNSRSLLPLSSLPGRASLWLKPALCFLPFCTRKAGSCCLGLNSTGYHLEIVSCSRCKPGQCWSGVKVKEIKDSGRT